MSLIDLMERLSSAVVTADSGDLQGLAQMHTYCQAIRTEAQQLPGPRQHVEAVGRMASEAERLLSALILGELADAAAGLEKLNQSVAGLQRLVAGAMSGEGVTAAPEDDSPAPSQPPPPDAAAPAVASVPATASEGTGGTKAETVISADDASLVQEFIAEARSHLESAEAQLLKVEEQPDDPEAVNAIFRAFHTIKGVAGFLNLQQISALAHAAENLLDLARQGRLRLVGTAVDLVLESVDVMKALIALLEDAMQKSTPVAPHADLEKLLARLKACAAGEAMEEAAAPAMAAATAAKPADVPKPPAASQAATGDATVKIATGRLDSLINMVGELVIAESMVRQDYAALVGSNQRLVRNVSHLGKITRSLQELSMSMRMVPVQGVFQKMARLVRDLSRKAGKSIDFVMTGGETELDRNVVEAIADPLVHMVRNSVDHGVEPADVRQQQGKPANGRVELQAFHQGGNIVIRITDDGRGLNRKRIVQKAVAAGLVREGQELSDQEIFALIFHPGLSTAEKVTDVSGRGVGMDVVKRNIESLRRRIEIQSEEGKGSTFTIRLPLTLAVIDGLVVKVGAQRYILPMTSIEESLRPSARNCPRWRGVARCAWFAGRCCRCTGCTACSASSRCTPTPPKHSW